MSAAASATPSIGSANIAPHRFKPGENGKHRRSKRFVELHDALSAELGDLSASDSAMLDLGCNELVRAERATNNDDVVRLTNLATRLLAKLQDKRKPKRERGPPRPLLDVLQEEGEQE